MWLDLQTTRMSQELNSKLCHNSYVLMILSCTVWKHQLSRSINYVSIDGRVCFHRQLFANFVKPHWYITGPWGPLVSTNWNWLCVRLLPMAVLIYLVVCVHYCRLLGTQHQSLWPDGREGPPSACPPIPHPHLLINNAHAIAVVVKNYPAVNTAWQS